MHENIDLLDEDEGFTDVSEEEAPEPTETELIARSVTEVRDLELREARYQKLIKLGAPEHKARECCVSEGAFVALRIYLRGK